MSARTRRGGGTIRYDKKAGCFVGRLSTVIDGKRVRPAVTGETYTKCSNALEKLRAEIARSETPAKRDRDSVGEYLRNWITISNVASSTRDRNRSTLKKVESRKWFVDAKMHELNSTLVLKLYKELENESDSARRKVHTMLHSAFEDARHLGRIGANPCDVPKKAKPQYARPDVHPMDEAQEAAFLRTIKGNTFEPLFVLALDSGARQGELFALEWSEVDLKAGTVRIRQTVKDDNGKITVGPTKTKASRTLTIAPTTLALLQAHRKAQVDKLGIQRLVFPDRDGGHIRRQNFNRRAWRAIMEAAVLGDFTFHDLRHTCATMLLRNGEPIANVSKRLGHSKISTTLDYYAHALPQDDARPADAFQRRLQSYGT